VPTVLRLNENSYTAPDIKVARLFDQILEPIAFFDADNHLTACNLSFRNAFPVLIESEFLKRVSADSSFVRDDESLHLLPPGPKANTAIINFGEAPTNVSAPDARRMPNGGTFLTFGKSTALRNAEETHRKQLEALNAQLMAAHAARRDALEVARSRKDFLTSTSHELRTPLNAIMGFSEILATEMFGPLGNERYLEYAQIIHKSGKHVLNLINDLLDLAKLDAGKLELHLEQIEILKIVIDCVRCVETQAARTKVGISIHVCDNINQFLGDDKRIHQMLLNLLSNALKFTPDGGEVAVDVFRRGEAVAISVSDNGIGIKTEDIGKVLEPFGQVESELGRRNQGTGLGLPLTKELAELHGGSLTMDSNPGFGTTVTIMLPVTSGNPAPNMTLIN
jgi:two-component system cell cycle sensor histidine kinase PleC